MKCLTHSRYLTYCNYYTCPPIDSGSTHSPPLISLSGLHFSWYCKGLGFFDLASQLCLGNKYTHYILVKIFLDRFIADCCSCNHCLQSDDKLRIKACRHYLINLKLSSFWFHSMAFHKPRRAAKTVAWSPDRFQVVPLESGG